MTTPKAKLIRLKRCITIPLPLLRERHGVASRNGLVIRYTATTTAGISSVTRFEGTHANVYFSDLPFRRIISWFDLRRSADQSNGYE